MTRHSKLERLRAALPKQFNALQQPMAFDASAKKVDHSAKERQYKKSLVKFTKLLWTMEAEMSLGRLCEMEQGHASYMDGLQRSSPHEVTQLAFLMEVMALTLALMEPQTMYAHSRRRCRQ